MKLVQICVFSNVHIRSGVSIEIVLQTDVVASTYMVFPPNVENVFILTKRSILNCVWLSLAQTMPKPVENIH